MRVAGTLELSAGLPAFDRRRVRSVQRSAASYLAGPLRGAIADEWMGMRPLTPDGLPVIGRTRTWRNVSLATGHGMLGVLLAPVTGQHLAELILGEADGVQQAAFSPDRFATR
jgi:D-amino-acid dehydrogenase